MFSKNLKQIMQEKGITLSELSRITGIGKSSISQYLSGKNIPTSERIKVIADALGCAVEDLIVESSEPVKVHTKSGEMEVWNVPVELAAKLMHKKNNFVYKGLREGVFPWGYAVQLSTKWTYFISSVKFTEYTGIEVTR